MTEFQTVPKPGFTSIARLITAPKAHPTQGARGSLSAVALRVGGSRPCERLTRSSKPPEEPKNSSPALSSTSTDNHPNPRHPYLNAGEAIAIGILTTLFLLTAITNEFTARTNSPALYLLIPILTFVALHLLCLIASQLALFAKPLLRTDRPGRRDLTQGIIILTLFSIYAVLRIIYPIANWFTPIAYVWLAIITIDLIGRIIETATKPNPTSGGSF